MAGCIGGDRGVIGSWLTCIGPCTTNTRMISLVRDIYRRCSIADATYRLHVDAILQMVHDSVNTVAEIQPPRAGQYGKAPRPLLCGFVAGHTHVLSMSSRSGWDGIADRGVGAMLVV